jgi:hypothetical protein
MMLRLERKDQDGSSGDFGRIQITPAIDEDYWSYRVRLTDRQSIVGFPKFGTVGIGFAQEEDWNTNLPYTCEASMIFNHILHNKGDDSIPDEDVLTAIEMVREAATADRAQDNR